MACHTERRSQRETPFSLASIVLQIHNAYRASCVRSSIDRKRGHYLQFIKSAVEQFCRFVLRKNAFPFQQSKQTFHYNGHGVATSICDHVTISLASRILAIGVGWSRRGMCPFNSVSGPRRSPKTPRQFRLCGEHLAPCPLHEARWRFIENWRFRHRLAEEFFGSVLLVFGLMMLISPGRDQTKNSGTARSYSSLLAFKSSTVIDSRFAFFSLTPSRSRVTAPRTINAKGLDQGDAVLRNTVAQCLAMAAKMDKVRACGKAKGVRLWDVPSRRVRKIAPRCCVLNTYALPLLAKQAEIG
jgi:hypothetical protein